MPSEPRSGPAALVPPVSPFLWGWFTWYARRHLRRHFHTVRLDRAGHDPASIATAAAPDVPLVFYMNHPSWWDPLVALSLADRFWPARRHYGPIDARMLEKYAFFRKLGFFGVEPDSPRGAAAFLKTSAAVLAGRNACLWVTAEGEFADVRRRPLRLKPGLAHLARRMTRGLLVPLAIEYGYWTESKPEALVRFGTPLPAMGRGHSVAEWNDLLACRLGAEMDGLAASAAARDPARFRSLLGGGGGGGGTSAFYDSWRWLRAKAAGRAFHRGHMPEAEPIDSAAAAIGGAGRP